MSKRILTLIAVVAIGSLAPSVRAQPAAVQQAEAQVRALDRELQELEQGMRQSQALGISTGQIEQKIQETKRNRERWAQRLAQLRGGSGPTTGRPTPGGGSDRIRLLGVESESPAPRRR